MVEQTLNILIKKKLVFLLFTSISLVVMSSCNSVSEKSEAKQVPLEQVIEQNKTKIFELLQNKVFAKSTDVFQDSITLTSAVKSLYGAQKALWSDTSVLNNSANTFLGLIKNARYYGLDSSFYNTQELTKLRDSLIHKPGNQDLLAKSEWEYSKACISFFTHIKYGFVNHQDSDSLYYQLKIDSLTETQIKQIAESINKNEIPKAIESFEPSIFEYKNLVLAWRNFLQNKEITDKRIEVESLKIDSIATYSKAKEALILYGYLDTTTVKTDSGWREVLKQFQADHGLNQDGKIGSASAYALSRSNEDRWLSVASTLEKLKWDNKQTKSILYANIPAYSLKVVDNNEIKQTYRTVVGTRSNRTPVFHASMSYLIINPYWHIPYSISSKEILPKLQKDSSHASKKGYRIYDKNRNVVDAKSINWDKVSQSSFNYKISQVKSGGTALGKVKFIFANKHSIYFHDTPSKRLFKNDIRSYSHGCVRVQNPLELAAYLLHQQDSSMNLDSVNSIANSGEQKRFEIDSNRMVYITYHSAEGTKEGDIKFFRDIYKKEVGLKKEIKNIVTESQNRKNQ